MNGTDVLICVQIGGQYVAVGSQRNATITKTMATYDTSSKDSDEEQSEPGRLSSDIDLDGLYVPSDAAQAAIDVAYKTKAAVLVEVEENGQATETASCWITNFTKNHPDQDASTFTLGLHVNGGWSEAGS
jgi:TP901-1 family phage major tail protein